MKWTRSVGLVESIILIRENGLNPLADSEGNLPGGDEILIHSSSSGNSGLH